MSIRCIAVITAFLMVDAIPVRAGTVTYDFIQTSQDDTVGAILEFATPAASPSTSWSTSDSGAVLGFQITDNFPVGPGFYPASIISTVSSLSGSQLDAGAIEGSQGGYLASTSISSMADQSQIVVSYDDFAAISFGNWVLAGSTVPEPSTLVLTGLAGVVGLGLWARQRKKAV
jgi:PEP-CTERM motif